MSGSRVRQLVSTVGRSLPGRLRDTHHVITSGREVLLSTRGGTSSAVTRTGSCVTEVARRDRLMGRTRRETGRMIASTGRSTRRLHDDSIACTASILGCIRAGVRGVLSALGGGHRDLVSSGATTTERRRGWGVSTF